MTERLNALQIGSLAALAGLDKAEIADLTKGWGYTPRTEFARGFYRVSLGDKAHDMAAQADDMLASLQRARRDAV